MEANFVSSASLHMCLSSAIIFSKFFVRTVATAEFCVSSPNYLVDWCVCVPKSMLKQVISTLNPWLLDRIEGKEELGILYP